MQRLRVEFSREGPAKFVSHLEMVRCWQRVFRRAGWRVEFSQGFNPHPRIYFAAPLPVGVAAEAEVMETHLEEPRDLTSAREELLEQLPEGMSVSRVEEVPAEAPALARTVTAAAYRVACPGGIPEETLLAQTARVLGAERLPRVRARDRQPVEYDLRPLIHALGVAGASGDRVLLNMELRSDAAGTGRPDEVLRELGLDPAQCEVTRTALILTP